MLNRPSLSFGIKLLLSLLSGILMVVSFPETGSLWPLSFLAWIPLLWVEQDSYTHKKNRFALFCLAYLTFFIYNLGTTWWVYYASSEGAIMAFFANSLLMAIAFWLFHLLKRKLGERWNGPLLISVWITFEFLHFNWELSWPWLTFGNIFAKVPSIVQWYAFTGVLGGSIWILLINLLLFKTWRIYREKKNFSKPYLLWSGIFLIIPIIFSISLYFLKDTSGKPFHVTIVQPNIDPYNTKFTKSNEEQLTDLITLIDTKADSNTQLIIAPETALYPNGYIYENDLRKELFNYRIHEKRYQWNNAGLLIGASTYQTFDEKPSAAARFDSYYNQWVERYNSSLLFDAQSEPHIIHKSKLVLGVEKIPFTTMFPALEKLAIDLDGGSGTLGTEKGPKNFILNGIPFTADVCYESIYGAFVAKQSKSGSEFIAIITNDGWWKDTPGYRQHFDFARLRAIENNKYVARSANTGKSGIINNRGDVIRETGWWTQEVVNGTLFLNQRKTLYQIMGDYLGYLATFALVSFILARFYLAFGFHQNRK